MKNLRRILCMLLAVAMLLMAVPAYATNEPVDQYDDDISSDGELVVNVVNVNVDEPVIGQKPAAEAALSADPAAGLVAEATSVAMTWEIYDTENGFSALDDEAVFETGGIYRAIPDTDAILASVAEGYEIVGAELFINGQDYDINDGAVFGPLGLTVIGRVDITVDEPQLGVAPATTATIACDTEGALKSAAFTIPGWVETYYIEDPNADSEPVDDGSGSSVLPFDPAELDFSEIDKHALMYDTGLYPALSATGLLSVLMQIDFESIFASWDTYEQALSALPEDATTQQVLDVLGISTSIVTGEQLDAMVEDFYTNYSDSVDWLKVYEILGIQFPSYDFYVTEFRKGGYYLPNVEDAIYDLVADGYAISPFTTVIAINGNTNGDSFGPVGFTEIASVDLKLNVPVGGTVVDLPGYDPNDIEANWSWADQTDHPDFVIPAYQHFGVDTYNENGVFSYWNADDEYEMPFVGTFNCGETYYADAYFAADYGYVFGQGLKVTVNGKALSEFVYDESNETNSYADTFNFDKLYLSVRVSGTVDHDWGERVFAGKEGNDEIYTSTCKICAEKKTEKFPAFVDVVEGAFYEQSVQWAVTIGVTNGTSETTFSPGNKCTRGQVVTFLWRANGSPEPNITTHPFTDVSESAFYYKAMLWAVENDITAGLTETTFGPGKECTRGQVVTFLWRAQGKPEPTITTHPFTDVSESAFYYKAMLWAVENDITNGTSATTFGPSRPCTRGQVVTFLHRTFD